MRAVNNNYLEVCRLMASWSLTERVRFVAEELQNLNQIIGLGDGDVLQDAMSDIFTEKFEEAISRCDGDWEPPDPPGWEGGFADNH